MCAGRFADPTSSFRAGDRDELTAGIDPNWIGRRTRPCLQGASADAIDRADVIPVRDGMRGLLELPEILQSPASVADGLKTISAPVRPSIRAPSGNGDRNKYRRRCAYACVNM